MNITRLMIVGCVIAATALAAAQTAQVSLQATLTGVGKGKVTWKVKDKGNQHEAQLEVEGEHLPRNQSFVLMIGSNAPVIVNTNGLGTYRLEQRFKTLTRP